MAPGKSKEAEIKRINKELANIRSKFKGDKALDGYSKKKYVCKLLFIFLLGHDIDFGHMEAVNLLSSNKYTEKQIVRLHVVQILLTTTGSSSLSPPSSFMTASCPAGLPLHLSAGQQQQRAHPSDQ